MLADVTSAEILVLKKTASRFKIFKVADYSRWFIFVWLLAFEMQSQAVGEQAVLYVRPGRAK